LRKQSASSRFVNLRGGRQVFETNKNVTRAIQVSVRILVASDCEVEIAKVVLNPSHVPIIPGLFKVIARGRIFDQRAIHISFGVIRPSQPSKQQSEPNMEASLQRLVVAGLNERPRQTVQT